MDNIISIAIFVAVIGLTLGITYWAAKQTTTASDFYTAGGSLTGWQNGMAIAGDYLSAASFLGIAGAISLNGFDGFYYSIGWLTAYLVVLFLIAEPLRNLGKFTMADMIGCTFWSKKGSRCCSVKYNYNCFILYACSTCRCRCTY